MHCRHLPLLFVTLLLTAQPKVPNDRFDVLRQDGVICIVRTAEGKYRSFQELPEDVRRTFDETRQAARTAPPSGSAAASVAFVVSNSGDDDDFDINDGIYSPATLRSAIQNANKLGGAHSIQFASGITTIMPASALPSITVGVTIDGTVAAGKVVLDGSLTASGPGLILGKTSTVTNMTVQHFKSVGIGTSSGAVNTSVKRCVFVHNSTGLNINGANTVIGGPDPADANVSYNNTQDGFALVFANDCIVQNNVSGSADGVTASPNTYSGLYVLGERATVMDNTLSGNNDSGLEMGEFSVNTFVQNNNIGLDKNGVGRLPNQYDGISTFADEDSIVGNFIGGNGYGITVLGQSSGCYIGYNSIGTNRTEDSLIGNRFGGLQILGSGVTVDGNIICANKGAGITLRGAGGTNVRYNYIGTSPNAMTAWGNTGVGISILSSNNVIGGPSPDDRNIISGNGGSGIEMYGGITFSFPGPSYPNYVRGNLIQNNYLGANYTGTGKIPNSTGLTLWGYIDSNFVRSNLISGNQHHGVWMRSVGGVPTRNEFTNNFIGTTISGTAALSNGDRGVYIQAGSDNVFGGTDISYANLISGNSGNGVWIQGGSSNRLRLNLIGTQIAGTLPLPNTGNGVYISSSSNNNVIEANLISGNGGDGIGIDTESGATPDGNVVIGNVIGLNYDGTSAVPNAGQGIYLYNARNTRIGGAAEDSSNTISGNEHGIYVYGDTSRGNIVRGNIIGLTSDGVTAAPNGRGIVLDHAKHNIIGGTEPLSGNIISGNVTEGIYLYMADSNKIYRNTIGMNALETAAVPNGFSGIMVDSSSGNIIGTEVNQSGNTISGNTKAGITVIGNSVFNRIVANNIGTDYTRTKTVGNGHNGIELYSYPYGSLVGKPGGGNVIANNGYNGIAVAHGYYNAISENSIHGNAYLGIDLYSGAWGVTPNDVLDADAGTNEEQNFPELIFADGPFPVRIVGTLKSTPNETVTVEFFSSGSADPSGYGEGKTFLGTELVGTDSTGFAYFSVLFPTSVAAGNIVTATATSYQGSTSEFSKGVEVKSGGTFADLSATVEASADTVRRGDTLAFLITVFNNGPDSATQVIVRDTLSRKLTYLADTASKGTTVYADRVLTATIPSLAAGEKAVIAVFAVADSFGIVHHSALVTAQQSDYDTLNNVGVDSVTAPVILAVRGVAPPLTYDLAQNYPNPFNPSTTIRYAVAESRTVRLTVYDVLGKVVATLVNEHQEPGYYSVRFHGNNLASGLYFYTLRAGEFTATKKLMLVK